MKYVAVVFFILLFSKVAYSEDKRLKDADIEYGQYLSGECATCHHKTGFKEGIPSINGLDFDTLVKALLAYKKKERDNPVMQMVAGRLDHNQIFSLAAYFSKLNPKK